jgi:alpha-glucosidase (family GH31 glycosyl hydrolase)
MGSKAADTRGVFHRVCATGRHRRARIGVKVVATLPPLLLLFLLLGQSAYGSVVIGPERVEVQGAGAGAIVTRSPFRIAFTGPGGVTVLQESANTSETSLPLERSVIDPASEPGGDTVYSPLSFLVGSDEPTAYTTGQFIGQLTGEYTGDLQSDGESGTEYSAESVLAATPEGEGVRLTLSTNDPGGMQMTVTIEPQSTSAGTAIRLSAVPSDPSHVAAMSDSFVSPPDEAFRGFGGRHNALDQRGQEFFNWVDQENVTESPEHISDTYLYPDGAQASYFPQSLFVSNAGYGYLLSTDALSRWSLDAAHPETWQAQAATDTLEYVVAPGTAEQAAAVLTAVAGRQPAPPRWALGPLFDREVEEPVETAGQYEAQLASDLENIKKYKMPITAYRVEGFGLMTRASLEGEISKLRKRHIRTLLYFRPFVGQEQIGTEYPGEYQTAVSDGYVATEEDGDPYIFTDNFGANGAVIDFTNPAAVAWWKGRIDDALTLGAEGFMLDFGEQVLPGMHFHDGLDGAQMHNLYPVLVQKVTREIVQSFEASHPGRSIVFFTRAGYTGKHSSTPYESFNFAGDETTDWSAASGLPSLAPDMLNRSIGGAYGYGPDIGGYLDVYDRIEGREQFSVKPTSRELFLRWAEWSALAPVFRLHGAIVAEHTPWSYSPATALFYQKLSRLHMRAEHLIEELWKRADVTGVPVARPLYLEYPEEPGAANQDEEWLLGPEVLVAPVVERGADSRTVYFPAGCWRDPETGVEEEGPTSAVIDAGLEQLPFFFACNTLPFDPPAPFNARH